MNQNSKPNPKILFINPKSLGMDALPLPPLGILWIAAYIRGFGYNNIEVIDDILLNLDEESLFSRIRDADVIGVTGTTSQIKYAIDIADRATELGKFTVCGGSHATPMARELLESSRFDVAVQGEGEVTFLELLEYYQGKRALKDIKGITYRRKDGICQNSPREFIKDLDSLPFPARDLVPIRDYPTRILKRFEGPYTSIISSRGCTNACIFCGGPLIWRKTYRFRSPENIFQEMLEVYHRYGIENIHFHDDNFTAIPANTVKLCDLIIQSKIDFKFSCITRVDKVDEQILGKLKKAGCVQIEFGAESANTRLLTIAKKRYNPAQVRKVFNLAKEKGLRAYAFFIVGLPGETIWSWLKTIIFAKRLRPTGGSVWTVFIPFPGTEAFQKRMVKILDFNYLNWLYKRPVIASGMFGPLALSMMRKTADIICNGLFNKGTYKYVKPKNLRAPKRTASERRG